MQTFAEKGSSFFCASTMPHISAEPRNCVLYSNPRSRRAILECVFVVVRHLLATPDLISYVEIPDTQIAPVACQRRCAGLHLCRRGFPPNELKLLPKERFEDRHRQRQMGFPCRYRYSWLRQNRQNRPSP